MKGSLTSVLRDIDLSPVTCYVCSNVPSTYNFLAIRKHFSKYEMGVCWSRLVTRLWLIVIILPRVRRRLCQVGSYHRVRLMIEHRQILMIIWLIYVWWFISFKYSDNQVRVAVSYFITIERALCEKEVPSFSSSLPPDLVTPEALA